jgi:wobble nucleotide-excising tRNase
MQIKRIKQIKNIGTFSNFENGASIGFEKMTFIYGLNTCGKTTLSDIFDSYKTNDSSIIEKRKTIPEITTEQRVSMTLSDGENGESDVVYSGGFWSQNCEKPEMDVFGTDFIHKNVFTGLTIERQNKENFTNFILGNQGVQLAEKIKDKKKILGKKKEN